jgi:hypothetical protein
MYISDLSMFTVVDELTVFPCEFPATFKFVQIGPAELVAFLDRVRKLVAVCRESMWPSVP